VGSGYHLGVRIALTGGIAEGKSTVLGFMAELGVPTFSADVFARDALQEPENWARIVDLFDGIEPDRSEIRDRALADDRFRRKLNQILHPWISAQLTDFHGVAEIPLLIETVRFSQMDAVIVVTCGADEQRRRLLARTGNEGLTDQLIAVQLPTVAKLPFADAIIRTNESLESVKRQSQAVLEKLHWPDADILRKPN
jgi:dephospho-CoA kinase